jgi:hypothetical protein
MRPDAALQARVDSTVHHEALKRGSGKRFCDSLSLANLVSWNRNNASLTPRWFFKTKFSFCLKIGLWVDRARRVSGPGIFFSADASTGKFKYETSRLPVQ